MVHTRKVHHNHRDLAHRDLAHRDRAHKVHNHMEVHTVEYGLHTHHGDHGVQENVEEVLVCWVVEGHTPNYRRVTDMDFLG